MNDTLTIYLKYIKQRQKMCETINKYGYKDKRSIIQSQELDKFVYELQRRRLFSNGVG